MSVLEQTTGSSEGSAREDTEQDSLASLLENLSLKGGEELPESSRPKNQSAVEYYCSNDRKDTEVLDYVIELFNFSPSMKTKDLLSELLAFGSAKMVLKWVDDTHALVVYADSTQARIASKAPYENFKARPLQKSSYGLSHSVAEKVAASIKQGLINEKRSRVVADDKPKTSAVVARRMVSHALGIRLNVNPEQRQKERRELQRVKEAKKLNQDSSSP